MYGLYLIIHLVNNQKLNFYIAKVIFNHYELKLPYSQRKTVEDPKDYSTSWNEKPIFDIKNEQIKNALEDVYNKGKEETYNNIINPNLIEIKELSFTWYLNEINNKSNKTVLSCIGKGLTNSSKSITTEGFKTNRYKKGFLQ